MRRKKDGGKKESSSAAKNRRRRNTQQSSTDQMPRPVCIPRQAGSRVVGGVTPSGPRALITQKDSVINCTTAASYRRRQAECNHTYTGCTLLLFPGVANAAATPHTTENSSGRSRTILAQRSYIVHCRRHPLTSLPQR